LLYTHQIQVVDWPAGVSPIGADFVFKDLKTDELKALVAPYLKSRMGMEYYHEIARVERQDVRKRGGGVEIPGRELSLRPWSDGKIGDVFVMFLLTNYPESKETFINEDPETLDIPLVTDTKGKVLRVLMDSSTFMKNLPPALALPDPSTPHQYSLSPPSSPMSWSMAPPDDYDQSHRLSPIPPRQPASRSWSSSQPHHDHRQNFHPAPTRIPPRQLAVAHTNLHKVQAAQTSRKRRRGDESESEVPKNIVQVKRPGVQYVLIYYHSMNRYLLPLPVIVICITLASSTICSAIMPMPLLPIIIALHH